MAEMKTKKNDLSVEAFVDGIKDEKTREECRAVMTLLKKATGAEPKMWGTSIVGFGEYHYKYESGREGDWFIAGFSPRKANLTLYLSSGFEAYPEEMNKLGKYKTGKSCLYIKQLEDIDAKLLAKIVKDATKKMKTKKAK